MRESRTPKAASCGVFPENLFIASLRPKTREHVQPLVAFLFLNSSCGNRAEESWLQSLEPFRCSRKNTKMWRNLVGANTPCTLQSL